MLGKAQEKLASIDKLRTQLSRLSDGLKGDVNLLNANTEKMRKANQLKFVEIDKKVRVLESAQGYRLERAITDLEAQARQLTIFQTEHRNLEFYIEKILPIKGHSQICSALHNILR